jgi:hypothetical protein
MPTALTENDPEIRDSSVYWFIVWERAASRGECQEAARAQRKLQRLGVTVQYLGQRPLRLQDGLSHRGMRGTP